MGFNVHEWLFSIPKGISPIALIDHVTLFSDGLWFVNINDLQSAQLRRKWSILAEENLQGRLITN